MCYPVCRVVHIKGSLLLIGRAAPVVVAAGFLSCYLNESLPYENVLSASLNKTTFIPLFIHEIVVCIKVNTCDCGVYKSKCT